MCWNVCSSNSWNNAIQWPLRRSSSFKVTDFGANRKLIYDFLLVINTNLAPILHRFRDISLRNVQNRYIWLPLFGLTPRRTEGFPWDDLRKIFIQRSQIAKVPNGIETLPKISIAWVGCTNVTDDRWQTDRGQTDLWLYSERECGFTFAKNEMENCHLISMRLQFHHNS